MADIAILYGLLCADPLAVHQAMANLDLQEVKRLGCTMKKPYSLGFRVLRCEPWNMEVYQKSFSHPVQQDASLPYGVCEVEAILADGLVATAFTDYGLIVPWSRMKLAIPQYQGPTAR